MDSGVMRFEDIIKSVIESHFGEPIDSKLLARIHGEVDAKAKDGERVREMMYDPKTGIIAGTYLQPVRFEVYIG